MTRVLQLYIAWPMANNFARLSPMPDIKEATVRRQINGEYSLSCILSKGSMLENEIGVGMAIKATVNEAGDEQMFIVKRRSRSLTGDMQIYAEHVSYLYNGIILHAGSANPNGRASNVFRNIRTGAVPDITGICTWTYGRDAALRADFPQRRGPISVSTALKSFLVGAAGGELIFDGLDVTYVDAMGANNGAVYRYGVNLTDMQTEDILDQYHSGIYPYWGAQDDENKPLTTIQGGVYNYSGSYDITYIRPVDMTSLFETQPTQQQLLDACAAYAARYAPAPGWAGIPFSTTASRVRIEGDTAVDLGDTVRVVNTPWGVDINTRIYSMTFDALRGRVIDVEFGTVNPGFAGAITDLIIGDGGVYNIVTPHRN